MADDEDTEDKSTADSSAVSTADAGKPPAGGGGGSTLVLLLLVFMFLALAAGGAVYAFALSGGGDDSAANKSERWGGAACPTVAATMTTDRRFASSPFQRTTEGRNGSVPFVETTSFLSVIRRCASSISSRSTLGRQQNTRIPRTGRITEAPIGATRLTPDAVPTIFPNSPSYLSNYAPVREGPDQKKKRLEASHLEEAIRQSIALHEEEEHRNKLSSYEDLVSRLQGLGLSTYWATVKAENAVLFVHISGEDPPVVERSVIVSRNMEITAFWKKVKVPAKDLLIPATLDDLRSLHTY
ncbi:hypothetical protein HPB50_022752 [Hyalomma asiaticum]|uniref:Uncharacterized protein n=1 Tax=Hyalomma asiaticum TaxID=266040 RepID=A0ACB7RTE6_HYAAI|nr:hypothetical protein HPB50_022752 [Hyalomma asiaticum]